jgi:hypothetical protein
LINSMQQVSKENKETEDGTPEDRFRLQST